MSWVMYGRTARMGQALRRHRVLVLILSGLVAAGLAAFFIAPWLDYEAKIAPLHSPDREVRELAIFRLGRSPSATKYVPELTAALQDRDDVVRASAVLVLSQIRDLRTVEPSISFLHDKNPSVRVSAAELLGYFHDVRAVEPLISALHDENASVRNASARALGMFRDKRAAEALNSSLRDADVSVRLEAAKALTGFRDGRALEPLIELLHNEDVRREAAEALGELGDARAVEPLIQALSDKDYLVRGNSAEALGRIADNRAVGPLILLLNDQKRDEVLSTGEETTTVRGKAAEALGHLTDPRIIPALVNSLADWNASRKALESLKRQKWLPLTSREVFLVWIAKDDREHLLADWSKTKQLLVDELKTNNRAAIYNAVRAGIRLNQPDFFPIAIRALNVSGDATLAEVFLNSNQERLRRAGRTWADVHGYQISYRPVY